MRSALAHMTLVGGSVAIVIAACGGRLYGNPPGYLDDAGAFHWPDGAVEYGQGTACVGYDPTVSFPKTLKPYPTCQSVADCAALFPPNYPVHFTGCQSNQCASDFIVEDYYPDDRIYCTQGPLGDAFCSAFFNQFVVGDAHVQTSCVHECIRDTGNQADPNAPCQEEFDQCVINKPDGQTCSCNEDWVLANTGLCVVRGDASVARCEAPCSAPTDAGSATDAGGDL